MKMIQETDPGAGIEFERMGQIEIPAGHSSWSTYEALNLPLRD
jgi:hypothetical protein